MATYTVIPRGDLLAWVNSARTLLDETERRIAAGVDDVWGEMESTAASLPPLPALPSWVVSTQFGVTPGEVSAHLTGEVIDVTGLELSLLALVTIELSEELPLVQFHEPLIDVRAVSADQMRSTFEDWLADASPTNLDELASALSRAGNALRSAIELHLSRGRIL